MRYTLQDYSDVIFAGNDYILPDNTNSIIKNLILELGVSSNTETYKIDNTISSKPMYKKQPYFNNKKNRNRNENLDESWDTMKMSAIEFKSTIIEKKEGLDKLINDVRICLNKISNKNYEAQRDAIIMCIENIINLPSEESSDDDEEKNAVNLKNFNIIANYVFDIASTNKFYSDVYASLFKELIEKVPLFRSNIDINQVLEQYKEDIHKIKFVDQNVDYDKFCDNNKLNDKRKALSTFIVNLMKKDVIDISSISDIILYLEDIITKNIDVENMVYEIEEITENLFIFVTLSLSELKNYKAWNIILDNIQTFSKYKVKEHLSISSRAIFKYMDILDEIKK
jgi:hypothetical protein